MSKSNLHDIRISKNMSQSQLSRLSCVNLRTLQDFEQGRKPLTNARAEMIYRLSLALDCSIGELLSDSHIDVEIEANKNMKHLQKYYDFASVPLYDKYYSFPIIVPNSKIDMSRIYPTKQFLVNELHKALYPDSRITSVMLFGSSVTMQCNNDSDIDLAVRLNKYNPLNDTKNDISEIIQEVCNWNADIIWYDRISKNDRIYHDICKGVQIV